MKVFKFGGASVNSIERINMVGNILKQFPNEKLLIVISAMGKTTNALEKVVEAFYNGKKEASLQLFELVKTQHLNTAKQLLVTHYLSCEEQLKSFFTEAEWLLHDNPQKPYDYYYDQVVCIGELLSTTIISFYLNEIGVTNKWMDVRDIIRTDDNFMDANIEWEFTNAKVSASILPLFKETNFILTQGFIGATDENESTTLGREGSDYTAAVFANLLNAESQTIWKDVSSVMNADPKQFPDAQPIAELNYNEVIEMAYYGAQVIHPKTIKPLQNKNIPLYVKCFLDPLLPGTVIHNHPVHHLPPIIVNKEKQALVERQFGFADRDGSSPTNMVTLGGPGIGSDPPLTIITRSGLGASTEQDIVHEALHGTSQENTGGLQRPDYPLRQFPHQEQYNRAACRLLGKYGC